MSLVTFVAYLIDKRRAEKQKWRIPESTLHLLELFAGWPGALIAQSFIHHKNKKFSYQLIFWTIVTLHLVIWLYLLLKGSEVLFN